MLLLVNDTVLRIYMARVNCSKTNRIGGARAKHGMQLLRVENIRKLALAIPGHCRFFFQRDVIEGDATLGGETGMAVRCNVDYPHDVFGGLGCSSLKERQKVGCEEPVGEVVGLMVERSALL